MESYFKKGDHNALCDRCGFHFKASDLKKDWQGFYVCKEDYEARHPMDFLRSKTEDTGVSFNRPDDTADNTTITNVVALDVLTITASRTANIHYYTTSGVDGNRVVNLPAANNSVFQNLEIVYSLILLEESTAGVASNSTISLGSVGGSSIIGSTTLNIGATAKFRNVYSTNTWIRES